MGLNEPEHDPKTGPQKEQPGQKAAIGLGSNMLAAFLLFGIVGYYLDFKRGGGYVWTVIGLSLAVLICGYEVWKLVRRLDEQDRRKKQDEKS